ncbi:redoxin domain-containing protein [Nocardioides sp. zg-579]|uniref:Redoxin domain-containing protein n=1 Tax=Nocardioides marmotae TaxID=2663857 RepID=A0A6I3JD90_9ACTN|nr:TlpA disulfide reductase family protein [Nocardioides marmotae]MCR6032475.1 redoxin domain-containing protein [Gordonia jinghuaiqii]MTB96124.1 redoxin domain-containing protein [Nocardioides marmotae]
MAPSTASSATLVLVDVDGAEHALPLRGADPLRVDGAALAEATGWALKPVGLCRGETCVPLLGRDVVDPDDPAAVDLRAWADALGRLVAADAEAGVVALAPSAAARAREVGDGRAPSLTLPDVDGNPVSFGDLSGHKRVLVTWASWCGCRHELAGWQRLQDELAETGLKVFSVALDADPEDARPWIEAGAPTYPVVVDTAHVTAERYGITNVPSVVWVDEEDRIVKPPTIAPGDDQFVEFTRIEAEQHHALLRRWARDGELPASAGATLPVRTDAEQLALAERRVAAHLQRTGRTDAARAHLAAAQELAPWDWTVRRGGIAMTGGDPFLGAEFTSFWEMWDASGRPGYPPTT